MLLFLSRRPISAARHVAWCRERWKAIVGACVAATVLAAYLIAFHLPLYADFSYLLPQDAPSVRDLRALEARVDTPDLLMIVIVAPTPAMRAAATAELLEEARSLPRELVARVDADDAEQRAFLRAHRHLLVPEADLVAARDALAQRLHDAKLAADPLYIDLDDNTDAAPAESDEHRLDELRARRRRAEARLDRSSSVSADGRTGVIEIHAAFRSTDPTMGARLLARLGAARARTMAAHPGVDVGFAGSVVSSVVEHDAIVNGIVWSTVVTAFLVVVVLALYFRSATMLALLVVAIVVATTASFGAAALTVGHLNAATAFLGAVIAGNGINYGIILIARYLEERRRGDDIETALAVAIGGTARPTAVAALCASISYGALAASGFKGFGDFALIGGVGMVLCWITTYTLLPALLVRFGRRARVRRGDPLLGSVLVTLVGFRRPRAVLAAGATLVIAAIAITIHFLAADPFEYDTRRLRSVSADAIASRYWWSVAHRALGQGDASRTFIAAGDRDEVRQIVRALRAREQALPERERAIGEVASILDVVPDRQPEKIAVLAEIRGLLDDGALDALDLRERAELEELRPPEHPAAITIASLPPSLREPFTEKNGRVGNIISVTPADRLDDWDGHDLIAFSNAVRRIELPGGKTVTTSGPSVIFVDVLRSIEHDTPIITVLAALGIVVLVLIVVGPNRRATAVLVATGAGSLCMVATCALCGLEVNFLNFIALPITLGLGVDYAINMAARYDRDAAPDPRAILRTSGSAVFVCSLTTIIGYASLLVGDNLAIRGFGQAALVGELTCVATALILVPALLARPNRATL